MATNNTITKAAALGVAKAMVKKKREQQEQLVEDFTKYCTDLYEQGVPSAAIEFHKKYRNYTNTTDRVQFEGAGLSYEYFSLSRPLPSNTMHSQVCRLNPLQAKEFLAKKQEFEKLDSETDELQNEIVNALLSLKTYTRIKESFPEAYEHLPIKVSTELVINIDKIRQKI